MGVWFNENKYSRLYFKLISTRASCSRTKSLATPGKYVSHHICPKSCGGTRSKLNLLLLTPKEHYIAHLLLTKMTTGQNHKHMVYSFNLMCKAVENKKKSSSLYEQLRIEHSKLASRQMINNHQNPDFIERRTVRSSNCMKRLFENVEFKNRHSERMRRCLKKQWENPEFRAKITNNIIARNSVPENRETFKNKMAALGMYTDPILLAKKAAKLKDPAFIEYVRQKNLERYKNPEARKAISKWASKPVVLDGIFLFDSRKDLGAFLGFHGTRSIYKFCRRNKHRITNYVEAK